MTPDNTRYLVGGTLHIKDIVEKIWMTEFMSSDIQTRLIKLLDFFDVQVVQNHIFTILGYFPHF